MVRVHPDPPTNLKLRGHSSAGRAPALQAGGHRFDPGWLHQDLDASDEIQREAPPRARFAVSFSIFRLLFNNSEEVKRIRFSQAGFVWVRDCITGAGALSASVLTKRSLWSFVWRRAELRVIGSSE
jgi:hypothetical protein